MVTYETFWQWLSGAGAHQTAERLDHTFLLFTSFFGLVTTLLVLFRQTHARKQVDAIKIIVNGRQQELLDWSHSLVTVLREEGLDIPPLPTAMRENMSPNIPTTSTETPESGTDEPAG